MADRTGFEEFVASRSSALLRTAYLLTGDHGLAEDLLQTALAKCWFAWARIDGAPEPYVRRALVTTYATWWRRRWRGERPADELPDRGDPAATRGLQRVTIDVRSVGRQTEQWAILELG